MDKSKFKLLIPISFKLIGITIGLLVGATVPIAFQSAENFEIVSVDREKDFNLSAAKTRAIEVESLFVSYLDKIKMVASLLHKQTDPGQREKSLDLTFRRDRDLISVEVRSRNPDVLPKRVVNTDYLKQYKLDKNYIDTVRSYQTKNNRFSFASVFADKVEIRNASLKEGAPLISIGVPIQKDEFDNVTHIAVGEVRLDRLQKTVASSGTTETYIVDKEGLLLAHADEELVFSAKQMGNIALVSDALKSTVKAGGKESFFIENEEYVGAYGKTPLGVTVLAQASKALVLEAAKQTKLDAFYIAGRVLSVAIFIIFLFSISLTAPIERLVDVTTQIAHGNFDVKANVKSRDEVGALGSAVDEMVVGLQERDKVKNVLNKFHGSSVAEDMIKGDLELGGSDKHVTVFFSDIRDFTKYSESHDAVEVVEMLNEYFQVMVGIVNRNNGVVDKFVGDAIMAVWGAPNASETDAHDAVKACIEMRQGLEELNKIRVDRGETPIKIGMGLHTGRVISGNIGSDERMEYTVIGDTVNQAARIEASTKAFGADLLVSDATKTAVEDKFIIESAGAAEVKGKSEALKLYKVRGYIDEDGNEVRVTTEWSDYEAGDADKVKIAS